MHKCLSAHVWYFLQVTPSIQISTTHGSPENGLIIRAGLAGTNGRNHGPDIKTKKVSTCIHNFFTLCKKDLRHIVRYLIMLLGTCKMWLDPPSDIIVKTNYMFCSFSNIYGHQFYWNK